MTTSTAKYKPKARQRRLDPFACPIKITNLLEQLIKELSPELTKHITIEELRKNNYELLVHILQRASNFIRSGSKSKPNRKTDKIPNYILLKIIDTMKRILVKETKNRISFRTFTDNYLRIIACPEDIKEWLRSNKITLFEALQLKRLSAENLEVSELEAESIRSSFFNKHIEEKWIIHRLREEIDIKLGKAPSQAIENNQLQTTNDNNTFAVLEPDLSISQNFFREQIYSMIEMLNSIEIEALTNEEQNKLLTQVDNVVLYIQKILKRQKKLAKEQKLETINLGFL